MLCCWDTCAVVISRAERETARQRERNLLLAGASTSNIDLCASRSLRRTTPSSSPPPNTTRNTPIDRRRRADISPRHHPPAVSTIPQFVACCSHKLTSRPHLSPPTRIYSALHHSAIVTTASSDNDLRGLIHRRHFFSATALQTEVHITDPW